MTVLLCVSGYFIIGAVAVGAACAISGENLMCFEINEIAELVLIWPVLVVLMSLWAFITLAYQAVSKLMGIVKRGSKNETD